MDAIVYIYISDISDFEFITCNVTLSDFIK